MDWIAQSKFRNWLIVVLLASNLLTVSIIWMQTAKRNEPEPKEQQLRASESVQLMRNALDLTEDQTRRLEQMRKERLEQSKEYNDRLTLLKTQLAEELFTAKPDTALANLKAKQIGELQSNVELVRFRYFNDMLAICTSEQREKLKPILLEVFGRKPPKDDLNERKQPDAPKGERFPPDNSRGEPQRKRPEDERGQEQQSQRDDKPRPPSLDEKLLKYSERLNLTDEQVKQVRAILLVAQQDGEQLRTRVNPDHNEIQTEKERIRKEEDDGIMKLLSENQKREFTMMISKRRQ
jgi:Spy/CpxP family protein refolding chaperone